MEYKLKEKTSDFIVKEILDVKFEDFGQYAIFLMEKENITSIFAIGKIAEFLNIEYKDVGFCGLKDKNAITFQYISIKSSLKEKVEKLNIFNVKLTFVGYLKEKLHLGMHIANQFEIVIRNLESNFNNKDINNLTIIPNYFGEQRFSKNNIEIGRYLIKKEYDKAIPLISSDNEHAKEYIKQKSNDYVGAIKMLNERVITIYVHAYQSYIFNEILSNYIKENYKEHISCKEIFGEITFPKMNINKENSDEIKKLLNEQLPLIGFDTEPTKEISNFLIEEKINIRDFINRQIPFLTFEEIPRNAFIELKKLEISKAITDELNSNKQKIKVSFELPKGSFATIAIRAMFCKD